MYSITLSCCFSLPLLLDRSLQSVAASLGGLLSQRHWQHGSYSADVVPALTGDAWLSGALGLDDVDELPGVGNRMRDSAAAAAPGDKK